jgi:hypothetical protein
VGCTEEEPGEEQRESTEGSQAGEEQTDRRSSCH